MGIMASNYTKKLLITTPLSLHIRGTGTKEALAAYTHRYDMITDRLVQSKKVQIC